MPDTGSQELSRLLDGVRRTLVTIPELRRVHFDVPDDIGPYPCVVIYPTAFECHLGSHSGDGGRPMFWTVHTIRIELHVARKDLKRDIETVIGFQRELPVRLYSAFHRDEIAGTMVVPGDPQLARNSVASIRGSLTELGWGSDANIGWRLEFDVTTESEIPA